MNLATQLGNELVNGVGQNRWSGLLLSCAEGSLRPPLQINNSKGKGFAFRFYGWEEIRMPG